MIAASRCLFRIDVARSLTNSYIKHKWCLYSAMDKRKPRIVLSEWRPVSTQVNSRASQSMSSQSSSHGGHLANNPEFDARTPLSIEDDMQVVGSLEEEPQYNVSSDISEVCLQKNSIHLVTEPAGPLTITEKHSVTVEAGSSLMRFIKGKGGATQKKIEEEFGVKVVFPPSREEDYIVIEGNSDENVTKASEKIQILIDEAVKSPNLDYSHFVSLPLAIYPELVDKLTNFQNSVLGISELNQDNKMESDYGETSDEEVKEQILDKEPLVAVQLKTEDTIPQVKVDITDIPLVSYVPKASKPSASESKTSKLSDLGIEKSIFIKPKTFHLTVLMLKLWNKERVKAAADVLQSIKAKVVDALDGRPVFVRLKGLQCMRTPVAKARVLYAPVEEVGDEDRLLRACQVITDAFVEAGLVLEKDIRQKLLLHATVMNARHRKRKKGSRKVDSFDARGIMKQYGSEEWGEYLIREAHLSRRFVFDENGYYHCCASIPFPENI